jgi:hypothetical protein
MVRAERKGRFLSRGTPFLQGLGMSLGVSRRAWAWWGAEHAIVDVVGEMARLWATGSELEQEACAVRVHWWLEDLFHAVGRLVVISRLGEIPELAVAATLALDGYLPVEIGEESGGFVIQVY